MKNMRYLSAVVGLFALLFATTGCKEEDKPESQTEERNPMTFNLSIATRTCYSTETYTEITDGFWLRVTSASGTSIYDGWANVTDGVITLANLEEGETLEWPEDKTEKVNVIGIFYHERLYSPLSVDLNYTYDNASLSHDYFLCTAHSGDSDFKDLLVAHSIVSKSQCSGGVVNLNFQHALTAIRTAVKMSDTRYYYELDAISAMAYPVGAYYFSPTDTSEDKWVNYYAYEQGVMDAFEAKYGEEALEQYMEEQGGYFLAEGVMTDKEGYYIYASGGSGADYGLGVPSSTNNNDYTLLLNRDVPDETPLQILVIPLDVEYSMSYSIYEYTQDGSEYTKGDLVRTIGNEGYDLGLQPTGKNVMCTVKVSMGGNSISIGGVDEEGRTMD